MEILTPGVIFARYTVRIDPRDGGNRPGAWPT